MIRLIVNADDFGRSPGVNAGVLEAHLRGIVTSATAMVLEKAAAAGIREAAERAPRMSLGLHFVLTGAVTPATAPGGIPTLAPDGRFPRAAKDLPERIPADEIRRELDAQLELFRRLSRKAPTHLDSHHHVALHPSVAPVFAAMARERALPARASSGGARRGLRDAGVKTPDRFVDGFFGESARFESLEKILEGLGDGTAELMCHPGRADAELRASSTYVDEREREIDVLTDPRIRELVRERKIDLVGFDLL